MYDLVSTFDKKDIKDLECKLSTKLGEISDEISTCQMTLNSLISQANSAFTLKKLLAYKDILVECKLLTLHDDPEQVLLEVCGSLINDSSIKSIVEDIVDLTKLCNTYKDYLIQIFSALEFGDKSKFREIHRDLSDKGFTVTKYEESNVFLSLRPSLVAGDCSLSDISID